MTQIKARKTESTNRRTTRGKAGSSKSGAQSRTKKSPTKAALKQLAKDWDHVT